MGETDKTGKQGRNKFNGLNELSKNDFRFVEKLLYEQKSHDTAILMLEGELEDALSNLLTVPSTSVINMAEPRSGEPLSHPESYLLHTEENLHIKYLRGRIAERKRHQRAISEALKALNEKEGQLVFLRYHEENSHNVCARALGMWSADEARPNRTYWRRRQQVVEKIAAFIGLI